ncbi:sodium bicarbonate cotransporter 3-like [Tachypleus tridentatus]|uniref:sodium bicarbonate cotransporter 3-like n=1 Tax=Tachypleus tridentatus TaxID=6853 RepID=UPI003FD1F753
MLKNFKFTSFFPSKIRAVISDFAVVIAVMVLIINDVCAGLNTAKLEVPHKFEDTSTEKVGLTYSLS